MARKKSPKVLAAVLIATSVAAISYKIYGVLKSHNGVDGSSRKENTALAKRAHYTSKSIALTLSHSVLSSGLPLNDILLSSANVTFILPPYLSVEDLAGQIECDEDSRLYELPQTLMENYKLLRCSNMDGYFHLLKNLKPDMLFVCADDLGIRDRAPPDLRRFVKEIITIDQDKDDVYSVLSDVFLS
ncbi:hypothetical protein JCM33374_g303 [Metschnikowia sp. JCM 33374]|nr:hypothetical protein JCM33374_g303 [Metschnikowia sp. JCM 33374]